MGISDLQERLEMPERIGISVSASGSASEEQEWSKKFRNLWARRRRGLHCQLGQVGCAAQRFGGVGKKMSIFKKAIESKLRVQIRANERLHPKMFGKKNDLWIFQNKREEAKILQGAGKLTTEEEMAGKPPRNKLDWLDWEEARRKEESAWTLERMWSKASMWSLRAKAMMARESQKSQKSKMCARRGR